jgi:hypothetical protein
MNPLDGAVVADSATMPAMTPLAFVLAIVLGLFAPLSSTAQPREHRLPSRPETVVWGEIPIDRPPVLTIASGDIVAVDTVSHSSATRTKTRLPFSAPAASLATKCCRTPSTSGRRGPAVRGRAAPDTS